jgi:hypothetical protein
MPADGATNVAPAGTSLATTAFGPILAPSPIVAPARTTAPSPNVTRFPTHVGGGAPSLRSRYPTVTP